MCSLRLREVEKGLRSCLCFVLSLLHLSPCLVVLLRQGRMKLASSPSECAQSVHERGWSEATKIAQMSSLENKEIRASTPSLFTHHTHRWRTALAGWQRCTVQCAPHSQRSARPRPGERGLLRSCRASSVGRAFSPHPAAATRRTHGHQIERPPAGTRQKIAVPATHAIIVRVTRPGVERGREVCYVASV